MALTGERKQLWSGPYHGCDLRRHVPALARTNPMIIAHTLINSVAFIGNTLLAGHESWLR
jgi:hypothetical protein